MKRFVIVIIDTGDRECEIISGDTSAAMAEQLLEGEM
jgi:hypothetical protein